MATASLKMRIQATPYTRGSTVKARCKARAEAGYPVHAGIDLVLQSGGRRNPRLPRTRGDRPQDWTPAIDSAAATPYTRGSTRVADLFPGSEVGYPVHAGIDPIAGVGRRQRRGLPRTRGDRPITLVACPATPPATPYTRGSTPTYSAGRRSVFGYPVHAGIDLDYGGGGIRMKRLPRTRGDRPV